MKKILAKLILKLIGWKIVLDGDEDSLNRCILVVAPHTHNSEYILGNLAYWVLGKPLKIIIKDAHTKAWYGFVVKALGGIGIDRSQRNDLVNFVAREFEKEDFSLVITPEGTRSRVEKWRKGFYYMAITAKVPIVLAVGDFKTKTMRLGYKISYERLIHMKYEEMLKEISDYIKKHNVVAKVPENWNPDIQ
ncbi:1-acyl-sn-glycerol-3-phosphate acyltransferase [Bergeyella cardium]|uniref:Glycerol acyltransferase n=1 Tax=Bergeyella cardium TaxID=1585976 RepID=A0A6P1QVW1_9FLAO|nr:1-acyl-sn-glycerol-3-phosphate acyltransferase [Bergeyella cardium]QHN65905.1 glycerol acyltransferase [Bergeyella cardium]WHE33509.1 1-acyl-sn-glycerol-3-phosphate acyltransferase [Bergeyella cardium]WHF60159.1 1-acyl-sn-glycerol-3-phosphate acyltransferase [Bergeyella cardium]